MNELKLYQVDAFTSKVFGGNPAAVVPLQSWLPSSTMQSIALENNLSETVFFVKNEEGYAIRWFTPTQEVPLCGHATLAAAHILFEELNHQGDQIHFSSASGPLIVSRGDHGYTMDFPAYEFTEAEVEEKHLACFDLKPSKIIHNERFEMFVFESPDNIINIAPDMVALSQFDIQGIIITAKGKDVDFVSRMFAPASGIPEDPVTGSAHCLLTPYWSEQLQKTQLSAKQLSKRRGMLNCELRGDRVFISGEAITYMKGDIFV